MLHASRHEGGERALSLSFSLRAEKRRYFFFLPPLAASRTVSDNGARVTVRYASRKDPPTIFFLPSDRRCSTMVVVVLRSGRRLTLADNHDPIPATFHARGSLRTRSNRADKGDDSVVSRAIGSPRSTSPISASTSLPRRRPIYRYGVRVYPVSLTTRGSPTNPLIPFLFPLVRLLIRTSTFEILTFP